MSLFAGLIIGLAIGLVAVVILAAFAIVVIYRSVSTHCLMNNKIAE